jgi:hypothetical protein
VLSGASAGRIQSPVTWLSPLENSNFAEYRDPDFQDRLDIDLPTRSLDSFWSGTFSGAAGDARSPGPAEHRLLNRKVDVFIDVRQQPASTAAGGRA